METIFTFTGEGGKKFSCSIPDTLLVNEKNIPSRILDAHRIQDQAPAKIVANQNQRIESLFRAWLAGKGQMTWKHHPLKFVEVKE